jgi:DNA-binding MarR family transcriptional regulator
MENLGSMLADTSRLLRRSFDVRARDIGVTRAQWQVLTTLLRHEGVNQGGLAELLDVDPITVCRMVDRLQDATLVERRADPADRRSWRLFLTPRAHDLLGQLRPLAEALIEEALAGIDLEERDKLRDLLDRIRDNLSLPPVEAKVSHG